MICIAGGDIDDAPRPPQTIKTRWVVDDFGNRVRVRRCSECRVWLPLDTDHFGARVAPVQFQARCRDCARTKVRERWANLPAEARRREIVRKREAAATNAEGMRRQRETKRRASAKARRNNPDRIRQTRIRWWAKLKADPQRYAEYLENRRIYRRLLRERRDGVDLAAIARQKGATNAYRADGGHRVPADPFRVWLEAIAAESAPDAYSVADGLDELAAKIGVDPRRLWGYRRGEYPSVNTRVIEPAIDRYGRTVLIRPAAGEAVAARVAEWADGLPGNGTRLLRYLDRAEQLADRVGPLVGSLVADVGDLYPEVADE